MAYDFLSSATVVGIVERAKNLAIARDVAGKMKFASGLSRLDMQRAVDAALEEVAVHSDAVMAEMNARATLRHQMQESPSAYKN